MAEERKNIELEEEIKVWKLKVEQVNSTLEVLKERDHEANVEIEKNKKILEELKDSVECPVCLEIPRQGPVFVCPNGHVVCCDCKKETCPKCRQNMGTGKSLLALRIIENIRHRCKFNHCQESFDLAKLVQHEQICVHRIVSCPDSDCNYQVPLSKLKDHLIKSSCFDGNEPIFLENLPYGFRVNFKDVGEVTGWTTDLLEFGGDNFGLLAEKANNFFVFSVVLFGSEKQCSKYSIDIKAFERDATSWEKSGNKFNFSGLPCSIDRSKAELKYLGLAVNTFGMEKLMDEENAFSVCVKIYKN